MLLPLAVIAWMAAPEWPARAGMLDSPWRDGWLPIATAVAATHPLPQVQADPPALDAGAPALAQATPAGPAQPMGVTAPGPASPTTASVNPATAQAPLQATQQVVTAPAAPGAAPTEGTVLMLGDSLMGEVAAGLRQNLPRTFRVVDRHKSSTGLTNLAYYDWPGTAAAATTETQPRWVIVHMGANDAQDMLLDGHWVHFGSDAWKAAYLSRAQSLLDRVHAAASGATVVWIGLPAMRADAFEAKMALIRTVQAAAATSRGVTYLDGHTALGAAYAKDAEVTPGRRQILRADDGIHYSRTGGSLLAHEAALAPVLGLPWGQL
jgi:hypothetical protein